MCALAFHPSLQHSSHCWSWEKIFSHSDHDFGSGNKDCWQTAVMIAILESHKFKFILDPKVTWMRSIANGRLGFSKDTQVSPYLSACHQVIYWPLLQWRMRTKG